MAIVYDTTMSPGKLQLLTAWLPPSESVDSQQPDVGQPATLPPAG